MSRSRKVEAAFAIVVMLGVAAAGGMLLVAAAVETVKAAFGQPPGDLGPPLLRAVFAVVLLLPAVRFGLGMRQGIKDAQS